MSNSSVRALTPTNIQNHIWSLRYSQQISYMTQTDLNDPYSSFYATTCVHVYKCTRNTVQWTPYTCSILHAKLVHNGWLAANLLITLEWACFPHPDRIFPTTLLYMTGKLTDTNASKVYTKRSIKLELECLRNVSISILNICVSHFCTWQSNTYTYLAL